jgi:hypothetical protein
MERVIKKEHIGRFGKLIAGPKEFEKTIYGKVLYVDYFGVVIFVDNDDIVSRFPANQVVVFDEQEFKDKSK